MEMNYECYEALSMSETITLKLFLRRFCRYEHFHTPFFSYTGVA